MAWQGTCAITNLPIYYRDKVVMFLIADTNNKVDGIGHCYSNISWSPRDLQIYGTYNEYGFVEKPKINNLKFLLRGNLSKYKSFKKVFEIMHDDKLIYENNYFNSDKGNLDTFNSRISLMMVHEFAWNDLISDYDNYKDKMIDIFLEFQKKYKNYTDKYIEVEIAIKCDTYLKDKFKRLLNYNKPVFLSESVIDYLKKLYTKENFDLPVEEFVSINDNIITEIAKFCQFSHNFGLVRRMWGPQSGCGQSEDHLDLHKNILKSSLNYIENKKKYYDE